MGKSKYKRDWSKYDENVITRYELMFPFYVFQHWWELLAEENRNAKKTYKAAFNAKFKNKNNRVSKHIYQLDFHKIHLNLTTSPKTSMEGVAKLPILVNSLKLITFTFWSK
ncbi:ORF1 in transposon ISC1058 [Sulfolobus islandicus Y.N.15.51]|uniref:ORF1 in transposon ISC1058 n=1 Tax=Saccharolobus islandicus (strain Y.N.15.51 / Yellowstone \|nr:ORF1 in transposon ISC1058 [Sulfolobus islandicus Y.N.15.51]